MNSQSINQSIRLVLRSRATESHRVFANMNSKDPSVFIRRPRRVYTDIKDNGVLIRTAKALANICI